MTGAGAPGRSGISHWLRREGLPLALLAAWLLLLFLPPLLRGEVLAGDDLLNEMAPLRGWLEREWLARGELPGWNRFLFCGYPNLSVQRSEVLYPPDVIFRRLPPALAYSWSAAGHLAFAALGVYVCGRGLALRPAGALLAALLFSSSFPYLGRFYPGHVTQIRCAAFVPWIMLCLEWLARGRPWRALPLLAALLALQAVAWSPDLFVYALYFYATFLLLRLWPFRCGLRRAGWRFTGFGLAVALALVPLLPTLGPLRANLPDLVRAQQFPAPVFNRAGWHTGLMLVMPRLFGDPLHNNYFIPVLTPLAAPEPGGRYHQVGIENYPYWEETIFCGVTGLLLALHGFGRRDRYRGRLLALLLLLLVLALGDLTPLYRLACLLPGLGWFRCPSRVLLFAALLLALFAGRGFDRLRRGRTGGGTGRWPLAVIAALLLSGFVFLANPAAVEGVLLPAGYSMIPPGAIRDSGLWLGLTAGAAGLGWLLTLRHSPRWRYALLVLAAGELWLWCVPLVVWTKLQPAPWWETLVPRASPPRRVNVVSATAPDRLLDYNLESCDGRDPLRIRRYEAWAATVNGDAGELVSAVKPFVSNILLRKFAGEEYGLMDVGYLVLAAPVPPANARLLARAPNSPECLYALREQPGRARLLARDGERVLTGKIGWREYDNDRMALTVSCTEPARLVLGTAYHRGWSATVDGRPVDLAPYRETFLALALAPGERRVELTYRLPGSWFPWWLARAWLWLLLAAALPAACCGRKIAMRFPGQ